MFSLEDVEAVFSMIQLVSYDERKRIKSNETELIVSAIPSGHSLGSAAWKIEISKFTIFYAIEMNDKNQQVTIPFDRNKFINANILITNGYLNYNNEGKQYFSVTEDRLKQKIEKVVIE